MVARSVPLSLEHEIDRARLILIGIITAAICGIAIFASFAHLKALNEPHAHHGFLTPYHTA